MRNVVRASFALVTVAISLAFLPPAALSDTVTQSIVLSAVVTNSPPPTSPFAAFNPALGTLLDLSVTLNGTLNYDGAAADHADIIGLADPLQAAFFGTQTLPGYGTNLPFSFNGTRSNAGLLAEYSGTGSRDLVFELVQNTGGDVFTVNGSGTVTFDYTPAATPEPGTLLLLGTGLASALGMRRKKLPC